MIDDVVDDATKKAAGFGRKKLSIGQAIRSAAAKEIASNPDLYDTEEKQSALIFDLIEKNIPSLSVESIRNRGVSNEDTGAVNQELLGAGQGEQLAEDILR
jgi:hypothetical protein